MDENERLKENLRRIGLNAYQSDVYLTLLEDGEASAVDVAKQSEVPSSRIYDVLNNLEQEGYVETFQRKGKRHARAKEPSEVVDTLRDVSEELLETATAVEDAWQPSVPTGHHIDLMEDTDATIEHAKNIIRKAETSVDVAATRSQYYQLREALSTAMANDVVVRVSVENIEREEIETDQPVTELRKRDIPGPFLAVSDRKYTCFTANERSPKSYGIVITGHYTSSIFSWHFQISWWAPCDPIYVRPDDDYPFVNLEAFIRAIYPIWREGAIIPVTVTGQDIDTGTERKVSGIVTNIYFPDMDITSSQRPGYSDLGSFATIFVTAADGTRYSIGSWGATYENIEARTITLHSAEIITASADYPFAPPR